VESIGTFLLDRFEGPWPRLKGFWELTKPRMNVVVLVTTVAGYW
jgi:heme O synthase-like polyprenyltransferase